MRMRRKAPVDPVPELNKAFVARAKQAGCLLVPYGGQTYIVGIDHARVMIFRQDGQHYGSGLWRGVYVHYESESNLNWKALDKIESALRGVSLARWGQDASGGLAKMRERRTTRRSTK